MHHLQNHEMDSSFSSLTVPPSRTTASPGPSTSFSAHQGIIFTYLHYCTFLSLLYRKKGQERVQETYMNIKITGVELIRGIYCKGADNAVCAALFEYYLCYVDRFFKPPPLMLTIEFSSTSISLDQERVRTALHHALPRMSRWREARETSTDATSDLSTQPVLPETLQPGASDTQYASDKCDVPSTATIATTAILRPRSHGRGAPERRRLLRCKFM